MKKRLGTLTPGEVLEQARQSLLSIWRRWNNEPEAARRELLWVWVTEAEARLLQAKRAMGLLVEGVCPKCSSTSLFLFDDDYGRQRGICKKCGWSDADDLQQIIRNTAKRIKSS